MRDIVKLALTLAVVAITSALILSGINAWTSPRIEENIRKQHIQVLERFFPGAGDFEELEIEGIVYDFIYSAGGEMLGVMARVEAQGYEGIITYYLPVDSQGYILGIHVVSHTETPGVGDVITRPSFQEQFTGKHFSDPITAGEDVDAVSGATVSTMAVINSIRRTVQAMAVDVLGEVEQEIDISLVPDGTYRGTGTGLKPGIVVEVTVENGFITEVHVISHDETPDYFVDAGEQVPSRIVDEQRTRVDAVTGATASSEGIMMAVEDALSGAQVKENDGGEEN